MPMEALRWFDTHPLAYWVIAGGALLLLGGWLMTGWWGATESSRPKAGWILALLLLVALFAWRWPTLLNPQEFNPDEAQVVAGAVTLQQDPVFWRSVDGHTSGPLNFYALLPMHWLGVPQGYFNARLTGLLLIWGALWCCYRMLRLDYGPAVSALGLFPALLFFATTTDGDFLQYSTEYLSFFLFTLSACLLWQAHRQGQPGEAYPHLPWLVAGFAMGLLPWAKLQAAPLAATLAAWGTGLAISKSARPWPARLAEVGRLAAAAITPGVFILLVVLGTSQWEHFFSSYIVNNLAYVDNEFTLRGTIQDFSRISQFTWNFPFYLVTPVTCLVLAGLAIWAGRRRPGALFLMGGCFTAVAVYSVLAPRHGFLHYLLFLVMPLTWWSGAALGELRQYLVAPRSRLVLGLGFILLAGVLTLITRARNPLPKPFGYLDKPWLQPTAMAGKWLNDHRQPGDRLAIWGWNCHLHVMTGMPQATREAQSERQIRESAQRDSYYRPRYLADLQRNEPAFFVDAVGHGAFAFTDRESAGHETFPALRDYVQTHYRLLRDLGYARIYVRTDRNPTHSQ